MDMKNKWILWVLIAVVQSAFAQEEFKLPELKTMKWGLIAGLNYDHMYGKEFGDFSQKNESNYKAGFHAGVFVNNQVGKFVALKHELVFSQKNMGVTLKGTGIETYASSLQVNSILLNPIHVAFTYKGLQVFAGPYVAGIIGASMQRQDENGVVYKDKSIYGGPEDDESEGNYLQKIDFGIQAGVEYHFKFNLFLGARFSHGFTPLFQYASSYDQGVNKNKIGIQNQGFNFSIGYAF